MTDRTYKFTITHTNYDNLVKIIGDEIKIDIPLATAIIKKDFMIVEAPVDTILHYLNKIDSFVPTEEIDQGDIADLYLNVDAALQAYYEDNGIND